MGSLKDDPHEDCGACGHYLEIFLFSNGQRDSPPRKYNVQVDDRWNTTLNFLARSQNGSDHTIELYTTDGKKIGRAHELSNGAAYVAVEPPQRFKPSDYDDYLMKASRSREKRQEILPENELLIKPDTTSSRHKSEEQIQDGTNIKIIQDITIRPTSGTAVKEQGAITKKIKSDLAKTAKPVGKNSNKQNQKDSALSQPYSYSMRRNTNNVTRPVKRKSIGPNYNPPNPITKPIERKSNKSEVAGSVITIIKKYQENTETAEAYDLLKNVDNVGVSYNNASGYNAKQKITVDSSVIERSILLPVSPEKDLPKSELVIPVPSQLNLQLENNHSVPVPDQNVKHVPDTLTTPPAADGPLSEYSKETDRTQIKSAELIKVPNDSQKSTIFGNQTGDNNFTIYVNRHDIDTLKLNIEIKNVPSPMQLGKHNRQGKTTTLFVNNPESDVGASSKNRAEPQNFREVPTLTEPWHGGHLYGQLQQMANNPGAVCGCDCYSYPRTEGVAPVYVDNNNYFIWMPPEELNEQLLSCACKLAMNPETNQEVPDYHELPIKQHSVKLDGDTRQPTITSDSNRKIISSISTIMQDRVIAKNQMPSDNGNVDEDAAKCACCSCSELNVQNIDLETPKCCDLQPATDFGKEQALTKKNPKMFQDAFTQTDWSGIVLEVRPREDGCYEFHIPSIKALKMNKSLY